MFQKILESNTKFWLRRGKKRQNGFRNRRQKLFDRFRKNKLVDASNFLIDAEKIGIEDKKLATLKENRPKWQGTIATKNCSIVSEKNIDASIFGKIEDKKPAAPREKRPKWQGTVATKNLFQKKITKVSQLKKNGTRPKVS